MAKAIINSGNRRLIGDLIEVKDEVQPGDNVIIRKAVELRCDMFLIPTPQGPVGIQKSTVTPLDAEEEPVNLLVKIDNIRWFDDMPDRGRKYDLMVQEFEDVMIQNRASRAGLTMPSRNSSPGKPGGGLIL
jgi:hypothetical protein